MSTTPNTPGVMALLAQQRQLPWRDGGEEAYAQLRAILEPIASAIDAGQIPTALYAKAVALSYTLKKASCSLFQRKFNLGYGDALKLIRHMQADGLLGDDPAAGVGWPFLFDPNNSTHLQATWRKLPEPPHE